MSPEATSRLALQASAGLCFLLAMITARSSWRSLGGMRVLLGRRVLRARLELRAEHTAFPTAFTGRSMVFERARVRGPHPTSRREVVLWERMRSSACDIVFEDGARRSVEWERTTVVTRRFVRRAMLRVLAHEVPSVKRRLLRGGYTTAPAPETLFQLEEEVVADGQDVLCVWDADQLFLSTVGSRLGILLRVGKRACLGLALALLMTLQGLLMLRALWLGA